MRERCCVSISQLACRFDEFDDDICAMVKSRYIGDGHPTFNRNPHNWYIKPYYWVDDHPLLNGNNGSLDPSTYMTFKNSLEFKGPTPAGSHVSPQEIASRPH